MGGPSVSAELLSPSIAWLGSGETQCSVPHLGALLKQTRREGAVLHFSCLSLKLTDQINGSDTSLKAKFLAFCRCVSVITFVRLGAGGGAKEN